MTILIDLTSLADNFSGIERYALCVTEQMINRRENNYILVFKREVHDVFSGLRSNVCNIVIPDKGKFISAQIILPIRLLSLKADCYYFPAFPAPFFFFNRNAITTIHDMGAWECPQTDRWWINLYFKILYRKAAMWNKKISTVSKFSKQRIKEILHVRSENICVAYSALSDGFSINGNEEMSRDKNLTKYCLPEKYILCLSTIEPRKNMRLLIDAFSELVQERKMEFDLVLAGRKGWLVDDILNNLPAGVKKKIHITGFIDNQDLPCVYGNAQYFVFPSIYEGFGLPPIEAMSQGVVVLSSDAASMPEILGDSAIYFTNNSIVSLKEKMIYMNTMEKNVKRELQIKGLERAKSFSWKITAETLLGFMNREN